MNIIRKNWELLVLLFLFTLFIIYGTTIPFRFTGFAAAVRKSATIAWCPFFNCCGGWTSRFDLVQNVVLFFPIGFLWGVFFRRSKRVISGILVSLLYGFILSSCVETLQLFTADRIVSVTDVLCNATGSVLGFISSLVVIPLIEKKRISEWHNLINVMVAPAVGSAFVIAEFLRPFDFSLDISMVIEKVRLLQAQPFKWVPSIRDDPTILLFYAFLTFSLLRIERLSLYRQVQRGYVIAALVASVFLIEPFQLIIISRVPAGLDILSGVAGVAFGVLFYIIREPLRIFIFQALLIVSIVCKYLFPFTVASEYQKGNWSPLIFNCSSNMMWFAGHIIELTVFFTFAGYGTFYFVKDSTMRKILIAFTIGVITVLELLQVSGTGSVAGISDMLIVLGALFAGAMLGEMKAEKTRA